MALLPPFPQLEQSGPSRVPCRISTALCTGPAGAPRLQDHPLGHAAAPELRQELCVAS